MERADANTTDNPYFFLEYAIPYICDYFQGMTVTVGLHSRLLAKKVTAHDVWEMFAAHYDGCNFVQVAPLMGEGVLPEQFIPANTMAGTNNMQILLVYLHIVRYYICR